MIIFSTDRKMISTFTDQLNISWKKLYINTELGSVALTERWYTSEAVPL